MSLATLAAPGTVAVRRVRCSTGTGAPGGGSGGARYRALDALDRLDPDSGLPRSAILVVRRLSGRVTGDPARVEGVDLRAAARRAHRAATGPAPSDCEAVVFADEAEVLACLFADVATGRALGWWWSALFTRGARAAGPPVVAAACVQLARAVPAAAAAAPRAAAAALALLPPVEVLRVLGLMADAHAAPRLAAAARRAVPAWAAVSTRATTTGPTASTPRAAGPAVPGGSAAAPWHGPLLAAAAGALAAVLVDTAARLRGDAAGARTEGVAHELSRRLEAALADPAPRPGPGPDAPAPEAVTGGRGDGRRPGGGHVTAGEREPTPGEGLAGGGPPGVVEVTPARQVPTALGGAFYLLNLLDRLDLPASAAGPGEPGALLNRWGVLALVLRSWQLRPDDELLDLLDELAGPLPGSREVAAWAYRRPPAVLPWYPPAPGTWCWWPAGDRLVVADAGVDAGAEGTPRGAMAAGGAGAGTGDGAGAGAAEGAGVVAGAGAAEGAGVVAGAGAVAGAGGVGAAAGAGLASGLVSGLAVVADVPLGGEGRAPASVARDEWARAWPEAAAVAPALHRQPPLPGPSGSGLAGWADRVAGLSAALLARAGLDVDVVRARATVEVTELTVRARLRLDDIDIGVRRAGLDRDPGWVPALGRTVELVFA